MLSRDLPSTPFSLSVLCLGVAEHGSAIPEDESFAMLDAFAQEGGNWADTAHVYASWLPNGEGQSERALGRWLHTRAPEKFYVATKVGHPDLQAMNASRLSPEEISDDFAGCLDRLNREAVELLYLHRDDVAVPVGEIIDALNVEVRAHRVTALGASNWTLERIEAANDYARSRDLTGFCVSQPGWSLAEPTPQTRGAALTVQMDDNSLRHHRETGFPVAAYSAQANGFFAHPLPNGEATPKQEALSRSYGTPRNFERHARARQLGAELGRSANEIALAYLWSQSFPAWAIIGPRRAEQLRDSLRAHDLKLSPEHIARLEA